MSYCLRQQRQLEQHRQSSAITRLYCAAVARVQRRELDRDAGAVDRRLAGSGRLADGVDRRLVGSEVALGIPLVSAPRPACRQE